MSLVIDLRDRDGGLIDRGWFRDGRAAVNGEWVTREEAVKRARPSVHLPYLQREWSLRIIFDDTEEREFRRVMSETPR